MAENSHIEWTTHTFNPWWGCTKVSDACKHCYADSLSKRYGRAVWGPQGTRVRTGPSNWNMPLKWEREAAKNGTRPRVFCASMADVFEGPETCQTEEAYAVITKGREDLYTIIRQTRYLWWLLLTKRPGNALKFLPEQFPNAAIGTSVGTVKDKTLIDDLREVPAVVRFLSCEPLVEDLGTLDLSGIDWVIVGGESGPGARPMPYEWVKSIQKQCDEQGVAFFFKQWGEHKFGVYLGKKTAGRELDGRTWDAIPPQFLALVERQTSSLTESGSPSTQTKNPGSEDKG